MIQIFAYCRCNLGDDLFILTLLRRYPQKRFFLRGYPAFVRIFKNEPNIRIGSRAVSFITRAADKLHKGLLDPVMTKAASGREATVRIGGSVFIEKKDGKEVRFPEKNKHFFIIGANFGPFQTKYFLESRGAKIRSASDCCFRDSYSYHLFSDYPQVRFAPDVLFGCPFLPQPANGEFVGISVIDFSQHASLGSLTRAYEQGIKAICEHWIAANKPIKLLGFCEAEGDGAVMERIVSACSCPDKIQRVMYKGDVDRFLTEINSCEVIYATRFHAMILGWTLNKNVVPVIYSEKQTHVIEDIDFKGAVWDAAGSAPVSEEVLSAQNGRLDPALLGKLRADAEKQFLGLDTFCEKL